MLIGTTLTYAKQKIKIIMIKKLHGKRQILKFPRGGG